MAYHSHPSHSDARFDVQGGLSGLPPYNPAAFEPPPSEAKPQTTRSGWARVKASIPKTTRTNNHDFASDFASTAADSGQGATDAFHRDAHVELETPLVDWNRDWGPAPIDWESRRQTMDKRWMVRVEPWWDRLPKDVKWDHISHETLSSTTTILAPMSWAVAVIDEMPFSLWWKDHTRQPEIDSKEEPWFHFYQNSNVVLKPLQHSEARVDPADSDMVLAVQSSNFRMEQWKNRTLKHKLARQVGKYQQSAAPQNFYVPMNPHSPRVDIYLRPAETTDMYQMRDIYNHYVNETVACPDGEAINIPTLLARWKDVGRNRLPWLVAVDKTQKYSKVPDNPTDFKHSARDEHIVGLAFAEDHHDIKGMYRYTVELEIFVKRGWQHNGVGKCLMDKMMAITDPDHIPRGGYDFGLPTTNLLQYEMGGSRVVKSIIVNVHYDAKDRERFEWLSKWLQETWKFSKVGEMEEIGYKLGKLVSRAIFLRKTGSAVQLVMGC